MNSIQHELDLRKIPELLCFKNGAPVTDRDGFQKRKEEIKKLISECEYGYIPNRPEHLRVEPKSADTAFAGGKAELKVFDFTATLLGREFTFPVTEIRPLKKEKVPAIVHISYRRDIPDKFLPAEEIVDRGFAIYNFAYGDITSDDGNFKNGIAPCFIKGKRKFTDPGKLAIWAWAAMRVMDYIATLDFIDTDNVAIASHSRLGICSLLAGAFDERFKYIISNCSGASGTSLSRGTNGEKIENITASHPYLFSTAYRKYAANEYALPFDQHALLSLCTPRHLLIGSAELDFLSDPTGEFLSLLLVNGAYRLYGKAGLIHKNVIPEANTILGEGDSLYHIRHGVRYFSREDWNVYMDFIIKKMNENKRGI